MLGGTHIIANNISSVCQTVKYSWHEESDLLVIDRQKKQLSGMAPVQPVLLLTFLPGVFQTVSATWRVKFRGIF